MAVTSRLVGILLIALAPGLASAQTPPSSAPGRFELEGYGALGRVLDSGEATVALPAAGAPITTSSPFFPSRRVSSWLFGDGAALLNSVNEQLGVTARITPLDNIIATIGRRAESSSSMGARMRFRTAPRVWTEISVDVTASAESVPASLIDAAETTRSSFVQAMTALFGSGPFSGTAVTATTTTAGGAWRDLTATIAANIELNPMAGITPTLTLGGGVVTRTGTQSAITIDGRYRTRILGTVPIDETDRVTVSSTANTAPVVVGGLALSRSIADRLILRVDGRIVAANRTVAAYLDATPSVSVGSPADYIESFTNPSVQFSNNTSTGRRSSLSGDALDHVEVARSTRLQTRALVTFGVAFRF